MSSAMAMRAAQGLYEKGYITYMRTDSTTLSDTALTAARNVISEKYGQAFVPDAPGTTPRRWPTRRRPTRPFARGRRVQDTRAGEQRGPQERGASLRADLEAHGGLSDDRCAGRHRAGTARGRELRQARRRVLASGTVITHQGFRRVYVEDTDEADETDASERRFRR